jgi:flagellar hook-length control protein FliK
MVRGEVARAELRLDPPDLGPLEVRISLVDGETRVSFVAPQAAVREAVEAALPRLREMLTATGLNLGQVDVSGGGARERAPADPPPGGPSQGPRRSRTDGVAMDPGRPAAIARGLFDAYA